MKKEDLLKKMFSLQDLKYRDMQKKIIPTVNPDSVIGVRTPDLRALAKEILKAGDYKDFLEDRLAFEFKCGLESEVQM